MDAPAAYYMPLQPTTGRTAPTARCAHHLWEVRSPGASHTQLLAHHCHMPPAHATLEQQNGCTRTLSHPWQRHPPPSRGTKTNRQNGASTMAPTTLATLPSPFLRWPNTAGPRPKPRPTPFHTTAHARALCGKPQTGPPTTRRERICFNPITPHKRSRRGQRMCRYEQGSE